VQAQKSYKRETWANFPTRITWASHQLQRCC
jgi:hypothetical protein